jgi:hypothetical protein
MNFKQFLQNLVIKFITWILNKPLMQYKGRDISTIALLADPITDDEMVRALVVGTAGLELKKGEYAYSAPIAGTFGPISITGNSLPVFSYLVFEKELMEFVSVTVELALPNTVRYVATINSTTAPDKHGQEIICKEEYKKPFQELAKHFFNYFPLHRVKRFAPDNITVIEDRLNVEPIQAKT